MLQTQQVHRAGCCGLERMGCCVRLSSRVSVSTGCGDSGTAIASLAVFSKQTKSLCLLSSRCPQLLDRYAR